VSVVLFNVLRFWVYFVTFRLVWFHLVWFVCTGRDARPNRKGGQRTQNTANTERPQGLHGPWPIIAPRRSHHPQRPLHLFRVTPRAQPESNRVPCGFCIFFAFCGIGGAATAAALTSALPLRASLLFLSLSRPLNSQWMPNSETVKCFFFGSRCCSSHGSATPTNQASQQTNPGQTGTGCTGRKVFYFIFSLYCLFTIMKTWSIPSLAIYLGFLKVKRLVSESRQRKHCLVF